MTADGSAARKRILVILNPTAGSARSARLHAIIERLQAFGCAVRLHEAGTVDDARRFLRDMTREAFDAIAVAGGDGTINAVLNGLPAGAPPLAVLPLGTANVLAREIALPRSVDGIAGTVAFGPSRPITVGTVNDRRFAVMASVGLDAEVVEHVSLDLKRYIGKSAYLYEIMRRTIAAPPPVYRLRLHDAEREARGVIIANGRHYAGRYVAAPAADLQKPSLEVCRLTRPGRLAAPGYLLSLALGRFAGRADVTIDEATHLEISGPPGAPVQADGDVLCRLPASVRVLPAAVDLIFPAADANPRPFPP